MLSAYPKQRPAGFSLIELMIAISIVAILLAVGLPSFNTWIQNARIRTATEAVLNGLQLARAEAVRRNTGVRFVLGTGSGWTVNVDADDSEIQSRSSAEGSPNVTLAITPGGATTATFNGLGRIVANTDASASLTDIELAVPSSVLSADLMRKLQIKITGGGQIRTCDPSYSAPDPRAC
jgi:type IV fimbrial biogenesis protein FimT